MQMGTFHHAMSVGIHRGMAKFALCVPCAAVVTVAGHDSCSGKAKAACLKQVLDRVLWYGLVLQHSPKDLASVAFAKTEIRAFSFTEKSFSAIQPQAAACQRGP
eukprot:887607-Rhodomonas_salina.2